VAAITSAFGDNTRRQIYLFARERQGVTATEVADHFTLHPNVARHHLDKLAAAVTSMSMSTATTPGWSSVKALSRGRRKHHGLGTALRDDLLLALLGRLLR